MALILDLLVVCFFGVFWISMATFAIIVAVIQYPFLYPIGGRTLCVKRTMQVADFYWDYLIRMIESWGRWQMELSGDKLPPHENAFVIANHRWIVDWSMIFCVAARKGRLGCSKFFCQGCYQILSWFWLGNLCDGLHISQTQLGERHGIHFQDI